jgi:hypothetical protein
MAMVNRRTEAAERFAERRRNEDEAPRLRDVVPTLATCRIEIAECRGGATTADVSHTRHIIVDRAPALLLIPCTDTACKDGGHDITTTLLRGLQEGELEIRGDDTCYGQVGTADCGRLLRFVARATYRTAE